MNVQRIITEVNEVSTKELYKLNTLDTDKLSSMLSDVASNIATVYKKQDGVLPCVEFTDEKGNVAYDNAWNLMSIMVDRYNKLVKNECLLRLSKTEKPLVSLCEELDYDAISVKEKSENGTFLKYVVVGSIRQINPMDLQRFCKGRDVKVGESEGWFDKIQWVNCMLTAKGMGELSEREIENLPTFNMSKAAKAIKADKNAVSNTKLLETVKDIVEDMIGADYAAKIRSQDVRYLKDCHSKKAKGNLKVEFAKNRAVCRVFVEICHRVIMELPAYQGVSREVRAESK